MTTRISTDWDNTCIGKAASVIHRKKPSTWLRHELGSQAALIDELILAGTYTADQIADELAIRFPNIQRTSRQWLDRLAEHVAHLERDNNGGGEPHNLIVKEDPTTGILSFDCSSKPPPCPHLPPDTRGRRGFKLSQYQ